MVTIKTSRFGLLAAGVAMVGFSIATPAFAEGTVEALPDLKIDKAKAELGKRLFFDRRLSGDAGIACSGCHQPESGFGSQQALSLEKAGYGEPSNGKVRKSDTRIPQYADIKKCACG